PWPKERPLLGTRHVNGEDNVGLAERVVRVRCQRSTCSGEVVIRYGCMLSRAALNSDGQAQRDQLLDRVWRCTDTRFRRVPLFKDGEPHYPASQLSFQRQRAAEARAPGPVLMLLDRPLGKRRPGSSSGRAGVKSAAVGAARDCQN